MGITGLLPLLKKASKNSHVRKFSGCTVAIDAYCWLHKGAFGCAEKLGKGEPTDAYITYCMKYIQVLLDNKIKPILVLDGRNLPSKEHTEKKRRQKREENRKLARKYLQEGNRKGAWECFTKCVDITPTMAREFIKVLREKKIDYVVAPYEADAQLAYLARTGIADIVITEDSDLVLFGCPRILFKMSVDGNGVFFDVDKLPQCFGLTKNKFNFDHFRWMCILSGCDYLASIPGIGLGRAKKVFLSLAVTQNDIREMILSVPSVLEKIQVEITDEYIDGFIQAENTFLYQLVFDTKKRMLIPLTPYPEDLGPKDLPFAGSYEHQDIAVELALGNVDLHSLKTVDRYEPLKSGYTTSSIWSPSFEVGKQNFAMKELKASGSVGMQISAPNSTSSTTSKKKRPLAVMNSDTEDNCPDDLDLLNMYSVPKTEPRNSEVLSSDEETEVKAVAKVEEDCSPSGLKRRRLSRQKTEENHDGSSSCYTRSTRSRVVPFQKSPENPKIHVKSKYWRSDEETASRTVKLELTDVKKEEKESDDESEDEDFSDLPQNLNIYSVESSQEDSALSDISASQRSLPYDSQKSGTSSEYFQTGIIKDCSVIIKKTDIQEITLEDDEDDEAYNSSNSNIKVESTSQSRSSTSSQFTRSFSTPTSSPATSTRSAASRAPTASASKSSTGRALRVGLSKSTKKDPKQPSVRDMFTRHKSVQ